MDAAKVCKGFMFAPVLDVDSGGFGAHRRRRQQFEVVVEDVEGLKQGDVGDEVFFIVFVFNGGVAFGDFFLFFLVGVQERQFAALRGFVVVLVFFPVFVFAFALGEVKRPGFLPVFFEDFVDVFLVAAQRRFARHS